MNTNQSTPGKTPEPMQIYISKDGREIGPFTLDDVVAMERQQLVSGQDLAWINGETKCVPLKTLLRKYPGSTGVVQPQHQPRRTSSSPTAGPPVKAGGDITDVVAQPILSRRNAVDYLYIASTVYGLVVVIDLCLGMVPMALFIAVLTLCLLFLHSRVAAILLLVLCSVDTLLALAQPSFLLILSFVQVAITVRAIEATIKLKRNKFPQ